MADISPTPLQGIELVLADLDGVVYRGPAAIPHAVESLNRASGTCRIGYITNNASRTAASVAAHLRELGLSPADDDVVTSSQAGVRLLSGLIPRASTVLVVGGEGLTSEVEKSGFTVTGSAADNPAAVIQGFASSVGWKHLAEASFALAADAEGKGIPWVATNTDWTILVAGGVAPGNGSLVSAVHSAVGRLPVVAGKPEVAIFHEATDRFGTSNALFIGDRLDTDILGANRAGIASAFVLTGIDKAKQLLAAGPDLRPRYLLDDLRQLHEPYPQTDFSADGTQATVGDSVVRLTGNRVEIVSAEAKQINLLRAACALIWGSGLAIYALDVDPALY